MADERGNPGQDPKTNEETGEAPAVPESAPEDAAASSVETPVPPPADEGEDEDEGERDRGKTPEEKAWREAGEAVALVSHEREEGERLTERQRTVARVFAETLISEEIRAACDADPGLLFEGYVVGLSANYLLAIRAALRFVEYSPIFFQIRPKGSPIAFRSFTALSPEDRERVLRRLDESRNQYVRALFRILRTVVHLTYYADPRVSRNLGFDPEAIRARAAAFRKDGAGGGAAGEGEER